MILKAPRSRFQTWGCIDVENFLAIINPPEAGILAVGSAREVPVVENGELKVGWRMKATISVDHRVSDGVEGCAVHAEAGRVPGKPGEDAGVKFKGSGPLVRPTLDYCAGDLIIRKLSA